MSKFFNDVVAKKTHLNTFQDSGSGKKKQQINPKDNFWPVRFKDYAFLFLGKTNEINVNQYPFK